LDITETIYGSDKAGLVYGYVFDPGQPGRLLDSAEAAHFLSVEAPVAGVSFVWLHFNVANAASERWLRDHLSAPEAFLESRLLMSSWNSQRSSVGELRPLGPACRAELQGCEDLHDRCRRNQVSNPRLSAPAMASAWVAAPIAAKSLVKPDSKSGVRIPKRVAISFVAFPAANNWSTSRSHGVI
jgi:hypothetical protein